MVIKTIEILKSAVIVWKKKKKTPAHAKKRRAYNDKDKSDPSLILNSTERKEWPAPTPGQ